MKKEKESISIFKNNPKKGGKLPPLPGIDPIDNDNVEEQRILQTKAPLPKKNILGVQDNDQSEALMLKGRQSVNTSNMNSFMQPPRSEIIGKSDFDSSPNKLHMPSANDILPNLKNNSNLSNNGLSAQGRGKKDQNIFNDSFNKSMQSGKPQEHYHKKLRRSFLAVTAVWRFLKILENIKQYGTSSNLYNIAFRSRKSVKRSIFPIAKNQSHVKAKVKLFLLVHPNSIYLTLWNVLLFFFVLYALIIMPYFSVFVQVDNVYQIAFENCMDICFIIDVILNFFIAILNSKEE